MKRVWGYYKAYDYIDVEDDATEDEIKQALADHVSYQNFTTVYPDEIYLSKTE